MLCHTTIAQFTFGYLANRTRHSARVITGRNLHSTQALLWRDGILDVCNIYTVFVVQPWYLQLLLEQRHFDNKYLLNFP
jgi:hypothetical protein